MHEVDAQIRALKTKFYISVILYDAGIALFSSTLYLFMESVGYGISDINLYISIFWVLSFFAEIPSGAMSDSLGRRNTAVLSGIVRAVGLFAVSLSGKNEMALIISAVLTALGTSLYSGSMSSWVIDEIKKIDSKYNFNEVFSISRTWGTLFSLMAGYLGAQVIGRINLAYPTIVSGIVLILTSVITWKMIENDRDFSNKLNANRFLEIYAETLKGGVKFFADNKFVLWIVITFVSTVFINTAPFNQWQLYYKIDEAGIISGYIYVGISLAGILGAYMASRIKVEKSLSVFLFCNALAAVFISASVFSKGFLPSIALFLAHVTVTSFAQIISFTYLNVFLHERTRSTVLSIYYACEAFFVVLVMKLNSILLDRFEIGYTWIISAAVGLLLTLCFYIKSVRSKKFIHRTDNVF